MLYLPSNDVILLRVRLTKIIKITKLFNFYPYVYFFIASFL